MNKKEAATYLLNALQTFSDDAPFMVRVLMEDLFSQEPIFALQLDTCIERLKNGEPLQYVSGRTNFYGYFFDVSPAALIPRPETEELVHWILQDFDGHPRTVVDIGTGSGCIPITLAKKREHWNLVGVDISEKALQLAQGNARKQEVSIDWQLLDFLQIFPDSAPDILVSNPPYIAHEDPVDKHVKSYEPTVALYPTGTDALIFYKRLAEWMAIANIRVGYFEINALLPEVTEEVFRAKGFKTILKSDLQGKPRMVKAISD